MSLSSPSHSFFNGDMVVVTEGELQNLKGEVNKTFVSNSCFQFCTNLNSQVTAIDGAKITIMPKHDDLKAPLEFQSNELKKYFQEVSHQINYISQID